MSADKKFKVALMYDFDKTLSTTNMQEYAFLPDLGMSPEEFWGKVGETSKRDNMDPTLAYMYMMVEMAAEKGQFIRKENLNKMGSSIEYFPGVEDYFQRINEYANSIGIELHHFIISSGNKEILEGCSIAKYFTAIFGCQFHYDKRGNADWASVAVDYTGKTQFLFRINKNALDITDSLKVNQYVSKQQRDIPFNHMIYLGDGASDVPCMKLVKDNGGYSIAVYDCNDCTATSLLKDDRVNFIAPADYRDNAKINNLIKHILDKMASEEKLNAF